MRQRMSTIEYKDIAQFICGRYGGKKVVEIGVGRLHEIARMISGCVDLTVTDIEPVGQGSGLRFVQDDVFQPDMDIYMNAGLIYSIRPPIEMQGAMGAIAERVGSDMVIRPLGTEDVLGHGRLVNFGKARFYFYDVSQQDA
ncbi:MAG TPA: hypothetical protein HA257_03930 [Candidatus Methanoperedenaceae archaeon]|nr:hypothetical protein [Candidatus Methanoperedenaceae archaeon]